MPQFLQESDDFWVVQDERTRHNALVLKAKWSSHYLGLIEQHDIKIIRLNEHLGWRGTDLTFLCQVPNLFGLDILSDHLIDLSPIFDLPSIESLSLFCKGKNARDFALLSKLRWIDLGWKNIFKSIFKTDFLQSINILAYPEKNLKIWVSNPRLECLRLESRFLEDLSGIDSFRRLQNLMFYRCRNLRSICQIADSPEITELRISKCPSIRDWTPIAQLSQLKTLEINDCHAINSVEPFAKCRNLERLQISGQSTVIDGDFSSLKKLPKLRTVLLHHHRHYSHSAEELEK